MKRALLFPVVAGLLLTANAVMSQDQKPVASPPASTTATIASGATITINYGQPSVKGRTIGKDLEPKPGEVWRTGANEASVFETDKDVTIEGQTLPAGKYGFFTLSGDNEWTIIFNKTWKQWGAFKYKEADDALRVKAPVTKAPAFSEKLTITANPDGKVSLLWGDNQVDFTVK
ncbi:MAG: DUF2911 domain-containing protein [Chitinophagaceae bacterium]|nr:DUF2911 domain-containing protein [Chitinophagaceae bacterium]